MKAKAFEVLSNGLTRKFHANGQSVWSLGKIENGSAEGYWEWYRVDGTLKRSGYFHLGVPIGEWITYDHQGNVYKVTQKGDAK